MMAGEKVIYTVEISRGAEALPEIFQGVGNHKFVAADPHVLVLFDRDDRHMAYRILGPTDKVNFKVEEIIPASKVLTPQLDSFIKH